MIDTPKWVQDAVFYQIFPDRFAKSERVSKEGLNIEAWDSPPTNYGFKGGDLLGVVEHLDYLQDLGVTALYFTPIFTSASNHRYHTYDYFHVDPLLGGNAALRELLDQAHRRRMRVVLDGVFNHASRGFWQFHHTIETGAASPYVNWFHFDPERLQGKRHFGAYPGPEEQAALLRGEGSLTALGYQAWWNLPALPKFNTNHPAVREFLFSVAEEWIRFGIDGWRLDVPAEIDDDSFWQEFRRRVRAINPEAYIVGEIWHDARRWLQGDQFDAVMNYLVTGACLGFFPGKNLDLSVVHESGSFKRSVRALDANEFADQIDGILGLYAPEVTRSQLNLLDSHDTPRFLSCASGDLPGLKLALMFMFTFPGAPCIFYGDEIGLDGRQDPECRKSFPWDVSKWNRDLRDYTKALIALRKAHAALRGTDFQRLYSAGGVYAFARGSGKDRIVVVLNAAEEERTVDLDGLDPGRKRPRTLSGPAKAQNAEGRLQVIIPARSGAVTQV